MTAKIFIDGAAGTTGLEIRDRLARRPDLSLISLADSERKDAGARKKALNQADLVILCLPDEAAREAVGLIDNPSVRVIDASTAHRVAEGWTYGFAELEPEQAGRIARAKRVANGGCWATGCNGCLLSITASKGVLLPGYCLSPLGYRIILGKKSTS